MVAKVNDKSTKTEIWAAYKELLETFQAAPAVVAGSTGGVNELGAALERSKSELLEKFEAALKAVGGAADDYAAAEQLLDKRKTESIEGLERSKAELQTVIDQVRKGWEQEQADHRHRHQQQPVRIAIEQDSNSPQRDKGHEDDQHLEPGDQVLEKFADQSGGRVFYPYKVEDLAQSFIDIGNELRSQYFIAYAPSNAESNGKYRKIEVQTDRKNLDVRTRRGYYATTPKNPLVPSSK